MSESFDPIPAMHDLDLRNKAAEAVIRTFAIEHVSVDVSSSMLLGLLPFGNLAALGIQLVYSAKRNYPQLVKKLAVIYSASPDDFTRQVVRNNLLIEGGIDALMATVGTDLLGQIALDAMNEFGTDFFQEIAGELISEAAVATGLSAIPIVGAFVGAGLDAMLGATMTWRVGCTVSAYFQAGGYIGSRKETYHLIKPEVDLSPEVSRPGLTSQIRKLGPIERRQKDYVRTYIRAYIGILDPAVIREMLVTKMRIPADIVDIVLKEF